MTNAYVRFGLGLCVGLSLATSLASLAGCGLVSSDVTNFDLTLPDKKFTIDAGSWKVDQTAADLYLTQSCTPSQQPDACSTAVQKACTKGCTGACGASSSKCELSLDVSLYTPVDLVMEKPELRSINDEPVIKVTVDSVTYDITSNTLNVDTPEVTVYVAPSSVLSASDPQAKAIGTIAPVPAGWVTESPQQVKFTATGKAELVNIMSSFKAPFNVLVGSSLVVKSGQPMPMGKLEAVVHIKAHAGL